MSTNTLSSYEAGASSAGSLKVDGPGEDQSRVAAPFRGRHQDVASFVRTLFLSGALGTSTMTAGVLTVPTMEFQRPGSVALVWVERRRRRNRLTAQQARALAFKIMQKVDQGIHEERTAEAAYLRLFDDAGV